MVLTGVSIVDGSPRAGVAVPRRGSVSPSLLQACLGFYPKVVYAVYNFVGVTSANEAVLCRADAGPRAAEAAEAASGSRWDSFHGVDVAKSSQACATNRAGAGARTPHPCSRSDRAAALALGSDRLQAWVHEYCRARLHGSTNQLDDEYAGGQRAVVVVSVLGTVVAVMAHGTS